MGELLLCPFCGGTPKVVTVNDRSWWVECRACEVETRSVFSEGDAVSQWNRRDVVIPAPFAALMRLGARLCRDHLSPTGGFCHTRYEYLDRIGIEEGVLMPGHLDSTGPVIKPGIADAIARLLAPDGAGEASSVCRWPKQGADPRVTSCGQRIAFNLSSDGEPCPSCGGRIVEVADGD